MLTLKMLSPSFADWFVKNAMVKTSSMLLIIKSVLTLKNLFNLLIFNNI